MCGACDSDSSVVCLLAGPEHAEEVFVRWDFEAKNFKHVRCEYADKMRYCYVEKK